MLCANVMIARTIFVAGRVQGVMFRDWTVQAAVSGWVRNRSDGRVEVYAVGEADLVERLTDRLREGSPASRVDRIEALDAQVQPADGFTERPTV
jgi:acylphosphatase